jgi:hypothetical protein
MTEIILDAFWDSVKMVPLLLAIYAGIELAEYKFGDAIIGKVKKAGSFGPLAGALAGIFPQCGFSVIASALFTQRLVTFGTLLAVYLATSDEALPIILSQPDKIGLVLPIIFTKLTIALAAGYAIDFAFRKKEQKKHWRTSPIIRAARTIKAIIMKPRWNRRLAAAILPARRQKIQPKGDIDSSGHPHCQNCIFYFWNDAGN